MLTKRTNILFEEKAWQILQSLAKTKNTSVGELVRQAVKEAYFLKNKQKKIAQACQTILALRKKYKKINYKELINYGRKFS